MIRKHPVVFGILLLFLTGVFFLLAVIFLSSIKGNRHTLSLNDKVGIVPIDSVINESKDTIEQLEKFGRDETVKAVVVRIDSPGGGVASSQEIYGAILELKKKKKVVVSMGSVSASGGYLISCAADKIVANPGTVTGSISAIMHFANAEELLKKIGLKGSVVKSGKYKDIGSPLREMTDEEKSIIQGLIDDIYEQFLEVIILNRKIPREDLIKIADGRVFSGRQAKQLRLVDELGDLNHAVRLAASISGMKEKPETVYPAKKKSTFFDMISQDITAALSSHLREKTSGLSGVNYLYQP
jgi:protease-4